ncbi:MAG: CAAX amino terminal protease self- immunity [Methanomethylovorans sp. PtaU1.Bin093]|uniref:CPBP family intramembrane glutamic endopeptidase n=1 Tax=Methanomethylovorans sp. PtaU1.Bin093 TaxID=1811679 RepID=UPI0009CA9C2E|nr:type II CAAX endopeptidase family protein [Methanomethylovorans sp. PtaU1.Bin093]OPY22129.1 MAG: CAAX amino terminal protease self- immunity [Methanomethylovorans sp. PtaU1.Bin093]
MQPNDDNFNGERQDLGSSNLATRSVRPVLATILLIAFAELLMFSGMRREAIILHTFVLIAVSISTVSQKDKYVAWALQALMLLPLLRLINFSMPVFSDMVLYRYFYIYIPLFIPIFLIIRHQSFSPVQLGLSFKKFVLYLPLSFVIGLLIAEAEFFIVPVVPLVPNMSFYNMVDIFLIMVFCVGLVEELVFRSLIQTRLEGLFGTTVGLIATSLLFGLMGSAYGTVSGVLFASLVGLILGYMFIKTRSLPFVALTHGLVNVFLFSLIPLLGPGIGIL